MVRSWNSRSNPGSSIQYGWSSPNGTSTSRRRVYVARLYRYSVWAASSSGVRQCGVSG